MAALLTPLRRSSRISALKEKIFCSSVAKNELSTENKAQVAVLHNEEKKEFFIQCGKDKAFLQYEPVDKAVVELWHTEVPMSLRGKGLAKYLAEAAFNHFVEADMKLHVTCTYLKKYLADNPKEEYMKRVLK